MNFCPVITYATKVTLRSGPILKVTCGDLVGHFELCPVWDVFYIVVVVSPSIAYIISVQVCQTTIVCLTKLDMLTTSKMARNI